MLLPKLFGDSTGYKLVKEALQDQYPESEPPKQHYHSLTVVQTNHPLFASMSLLIVKIC